MVNFAGSNGGFRMEVKQLYTGCLAEAAYYIESEGEVAIIDPLRETEQYVQMAKANNAQIKYVFETHFHADFVSGHVDLAQKTGAKIVYGPGAETEFDIHQAKDNEEFQIGKIKIRVLHTPGHTLESSTYLLIDENGKNHAIFTGDTLFLGDVGRPDLAIKSDLTKEDLAGMLYDSLRNKIMTLEDEVIVYPAHGAGSACGKNMSSETVGLLGEQKENNYALNADLSKEEFTKELLDGILPPPQYFAKNALMNKNGYSSFDDVLSKGNIPLEVSKFIDLVENHNALMLDVRSKQEFTEKHIPRSIFIGLDGSFATWVGALITDIKQPIVLIVPEGREEEAVTRLSRVGYDNSLGYLKGGIEAWENEGKETDAVKSVNAEDVARSFDNDKRNIIDSRKPGEFDAEHVENAISFPLDFINENMNSWKTDQDYYVHCLSGYRSIIFNSIMKSRGFHNIIDVAGGFKALQKTDIPMTEFICPSTL